MHVWSFFCQRTNNSLPNDTWPVHIHQYTRILHWRYKVSFFIPEVSFIRSFRHSLIPLPHPALTIPTFTKLHTPAIQYALTHYPICPHYPFILPFSLNDTIRGWHHNEVLTMLYTFAKHDSSSIKALKLAPSECCHPSDYIETSWEEGNRFCLSVTMG